MVAALAVMTVGAMVLLPSARARGWLKVKVTKHIFEHRYDYRSEWLRFTETLGRTGPDARPLGSGSSRRLPISSMLQAECCSRATRDPP